MNPEELETHLMAELKQITREHEAKKARIEMYANLSYIAVAAATLAVLFVPITIYSVRSRNAQIPAAEPNSEQPNTKMYHSPSGLELKDSDFWYDERGFAHYTDEFQERADEVTRNKGR